LSFFGNSNRPDLKVSNDLGDRGISDMRYLGEVTAPDKDLAIPTFAGDQELQPNSAPTPPERCTNIVATGAKWKGTLKVDDSVRIDGTFSGEIDTKGTVHVSDGADVDAKIHATFIIVSGNLKGEIRCDQRVEMMPHGKVGGQISTKTLLIHEGATLDGSVHMTETVSSKPTGSRGSASRTNGTSGTTSSNTSGAREYPAAEKRNGRSAEVVSTE